MESAAPASMTTSVTSRSATIPCPACGRLNRVDLARAGDRPVCGACKRPIALDQPLPAGDATLERVVRDSTVPVIVDFYADWCAPCRMMAPTFAELARRRLGTALVVKVDTDAHPDSAATHGVRGIPTLVVFDGGREVARQVGAVPLQRLEAMIPR